MFKAVLQEAAALASLALFVGMIAIWSQVFSNLCTGRALRRDAACQADPESRGVALRSESRSGTSGRPGMTRRR